MLKVAVKVTYNRLPKITAEMRPRARLAVQKTMLDIERISKESMQGPKSGRLYTRSGKPHQASAPGEAPAVDYGVLINSIQTGWMNETTGAVYTNTEYAPVLEFGGVKVAKRPFFTPAAKQCWPGFLEAMKRIVGT